MSGAHDMEAFTKCKICEFKASTESIFRMHMKYDHNEAVTMKTSSQNSTPSKSSNVCDLCDFHPSTEGILEMHLKYGHGITEPKKLELSPKSPASQVSTSSNNSNKSKGDEKFWCLGCDKWLSRSKIAVTNHLERHHGHEPCQVIMINKQGMSKYNKEDFVTKPRKRQWGVN